MVSCFSSTSAPSGTSRTGCFGSLLGRCKRSKSMGWSGDPDASRPHFKRTSDQEFGQLYKIGGTIGVGGFSIVKSGTHIESGEEVAIKMIDRSKYGPNDGTLEREIQVLEKVSHPNCIQFRECFFTKKYVYFITELVTGGELLDRILAKGRYSEPQAATTIKQIFEGVAYLHSVGIVHRDLKLENILLKTSDDDAPIKIADFGLSKLFGASTVLSTICGSPQYVAPEVLEVGHRRSSYTPAADLWSIGVILYILLSGFSPFDDASESELFKKIKKGSYSMKAPVWDIVSPGVLVTCWKWGAAKDLVHKLLVTIPERRLSARQALAHPWIHEMTSQQGFA